MLNLIFIKKSLICWKVLMDNKISAAFEQGDAKIDLRKVDSNQVFMVARIRIILILP